MSSHTGRPDYWNLKPMVYKENGEYVDLTGAFAIGLDAEYPWLTTTSEGVALTDGNRTAHVALGSYHDGSKLTVSAPEGITATVAGRYNECVLDRAHRHRQGNRRRNHRQRSWRRALHPSQGYRLGRHRRHHRRQQPHRKRHLRPLRPPRRQQYRRRRVHHPLHRRHQQKSSRKIITVQHTAHATAPRQPKLPGRFH